MGAKISSFASLIEPVLLGAIKSDAYELDAFELYPKKWAECIMHPPTGS